MGYYIGFCMLIVFVWLYRQEQISANVGCFLLCVPVEELSELMDQVD